MPSLAPGSGVRATTDAIERAIARTDIEGARHAEKLYGNNDDLELAALAAGTHPFQRDLPLDALANSKRDAAALIAAGEASQPRRA